VETLRITDLGEEEQGGYQSNKSSGAPSSIYSGLKKTSTVSETVDADTGEIHSDPTAGSPAPKIRSEVGGSKIRAMLATLNAEKD